MLARRRRRARGALPWAREAASWRTLAGYVPKMVIDLVEGRLGPTLAVDPLLQWSRRWQLLPYLELLLAVGR